MTDRSIDQGVLNEVPQILTRLVRYIIRAFYGIEYSLVVDVLIRKPGIKEDDIILLLHFERKQLRQFLTTLKLDKFVRVQMKVETDNEQKTTRHNYYSIHYTTFVNVVKYKLEHMRKKIEMEERDSTNRASFKCTNCQKLFTDLEADQLYDMITGEFRCTFCQCELEEEETTTPAEDARILMVKFNQQIEPIYSLLKQVEDMKLSPELNEPSPHEYNIAELRQANQKKSTDEGRWKEKNPSQYEPVNSQINIKLEEDDTVEHKQVPVWMQDTTIDGAESYLHETTIMAPPSSITNLSKSKNENDEIINTLLVHERKGKQNNQQMIPNLKPVESSDDSDSSSSDDEAKKTDTKKKSIQNKIEPMEIDNDASIYIKDKRYKFSEINEQILEKMTEREKNEYVRIAQRIYNCLYDI